MSWASDQFKRPWTWTMNSPQGNPVPEKLRKPGGDFKRQVTDPVKVWTQKLEHHVWGNEYPGQGITPSTDATAGIEEADTRATMAGRKNKFDEFSTANRRGVNVAMVNPNKGKKHSILTQKKKGGR